MTGKRRQRKGRGRAQAGDEPPQLSSTIRKNMRVRWFTSQAIGTQSSPSTITFQNIGDIWCMGVTATQLNQIWDAVVKVKRVSIWGAPGTAGAASTASVDFSGTSAGAVGDSDRHVATAIGTAKGPVLHARPKRTSMAADWQSSGSTSTAFTITCAANSIVELEYEGVNSEQLASRVCSTAGVGVTPGITYERGLDGVAVATSGYLTQGYAQL